jgi:phosophoadenylyl-sulfate reductase (thioredoxin)
MLSLIEPSQINSQNSQWTVDELKCLSASFEGRTPQDVLTWALNEFGDRLGIATGFGAEGIALIDMAVKLQPQVNVFYLDTDLLFPETYELRDRVEEKYKLKIFPFRSQLSLEQQAANYGEELWRTNPDLCCKLRKQEPLKQALQNLDAWVTAIRRDQSPTRAATGLIEWDQKWNLVKINPLAQWTRREVWQYIYRNNVPYNTLHDVGYPSIGCTHCTQPVQIGEDERAGRWRGQAKTECGLHV